MFPSTETADVKVPVFMLSFATGSEIELDTDAFGVLAAALRLERPELTVSVCGETRLAVCEKDDGDRVRT